eukprot:CAMPEP_0176370248 /NCGR_PEP_ID=MMETSP0126-20121128/23847_1 /TAXON_ID=141414 ORGANISM="Strombidinopsis acuminatum, Strain SPMC142" /NCGR_SAMPLE_ID=MMETSP0126 /ASSEMBLY_ACC=CAM_ASM_000229 /LENGTH=61 /DNA_ID=CAMNT_0017729193 /DNA_START=231 /DNA_END=416 /DNA_ORIENTATION=+
MTSKRQQYKLKKNVNKCKTNMTRMRSLCNKIKKNNIKKLNKINMTRIRKQFKKIKKKSVKL